MSKLLKRTLALALIFCLVLSVIPAVSAQETQPDVKAYTFKNYTALTKDVYATNGIRYVQHFGGSQSAASYFNVQHGSNYASWGVFVINVKESGTYQMTCGFVGGQYRGLGQIKLIPWTQDLEDAATTKGYAVWAPSDITSAAATASVIVDTTLTYTNNMTEHAYLGQVEIPAAGDYIVLVRNAGVGAAGGVSKSAPSSGTNAFKITELALHKGTATQAVQYALDQTSAKLKTYEYGYGLGVTLAADAVVGDLALPTGVDLELGGKNLTAGKIETADDSEYKTTVRDYTGTGVLKADSLSLRSDASKMPVTVSKDTTNTYKFITPGTDIKTVFCAAPVDNRDGAADGAKSFGFDIGMAAEAYGWDLSNMSVKLEVVVNGEEILGECNYTQTMFDEWKADKANAAKDTVFYVDVLNYEQLGDAQLMFRITVTSNSVKYVVTPTYPAA